MTAITLTKCCNAPLLYDAWVAWNPTRMKHEVVNVFDHNVCSCCFEEEPETKPLKRKYANDN